MQGLRGRLTLPDVVITDADPAGRDAEREKRSLWYFGGDYARLLALLSAKHSNCTIFPAGDAVNAVAARIRDEFLDLDKRLSSGRFPLAWAASDIAERNPLTSDLYLDVCRGIALIEATRDGGSHLVIVDDPALGRALAALCRRAGIAAQWRGAKPALLRPFWLAVNNHWRFLREWWDQRRALRAHSRLAAPAEILLMTWVDHRTFAGGKVPPVDRFFGKLPAWLREGGRRVGWLGNVLGSVREVAAASARVAPEEQLVLVPAFFGVVDLIRAYCCLLVVPFALRRRPVIGGVDITPLLRRALALELISTRLVSAARYAGLARRLQRLGLAPQTLFYTYENQPWEKVLLAGFRHALPSTRLIGIQHAPLAERYLSAHPGPQQWRDGTAPDLVATIGEEFRDRLIALGAPRERIVVGGALRFPAILSAQGIRREPSGAGARLVLAACSMDVREALELAHKAALATAGIDGVRLGVNFHPMVHADFRAEVRERVASLCDCRHVDFVDGSAEEWLGRTSLLLYSASGTSFEAAAMGVPAIFVGSELALDLDKTSGQGGVRCRGVDELRRLISRMLEDADFRRAHVVAAQTYLRRCFTPPTAAVWSELATGTRSRLGSAA